jgi:RNA polymerase sigma-70 factor (ECF subfamily)
MTLDAAILTRWFEDHRSFLWGLCYRVTGSASDADDVVQETFIKALEHSPDTLAEPRPWLVRVAVNLSRDLLRRRRRRVYVGEWLPDPIETNEPLPSYEPIVHGRETLEGRYDLMESVSIAFLQALEALSPTQRAVLLLCDVFDYTAAEAAAALDLSPGNIRTIHHRARRLMGSYDRKRTVPTAANRERTSGALRRFLDLLANSDVRGIERMLADDVRAVADSGGEFTAARRAIVGPSRVARFFVRLSQSRKTGLRTRLVTLNGLPAALLEFDKPMGRRPPKLAFAIGLNSEGLLSKLWVVASSRKLAAISSIH